MNVLQEIFQREVLKQLIMKFITQKTQEEDYVLSEERLREIETEMETQLFSSNSNNCDEDVSKLSEHGENILVRVDIEEEDFSLQIDIKGEDLTHLVDEYLEDVPKTAQDISELLLSDLKNRAPEMLLEYKECRNKFEQHIWLDWGKAFELLEMFIVIATEAGNEINEEFQESVSKSRDFVFEALIRLQVRACQVSNEILTLMKSGYADGAYARWRTMHEIAIVGYFVHKFGQDVAERYILHNTIESHRVVRQYQQYYTRLGYRSFPDEELVQFQASYEELIERFGSSYANSYGWASQALKKDNPNFSDLERVVGLEHWRSHYKMASHGVHANPKGVFFKMGVPEGEGLLLAGSSNTGFTDPAHGTAISLLQITTTLLKLNFNLDHLSLCYVLSSLAEEIGSTFLSIQKRLEK